MISADALRVSRFCSSILRVLDVRRGLHDRLQQISTRSSVRALPHIRLYQKGWLCDEGGLVDGACNPWYDACIHSSFMTSSKGHANFTGLVNGMSNALASVPPHLRLALPVAECGQCVSIIISCSAGTCLLQLLLINDADPKNTCQP